MSTTDAPLVRPDTLLDGIGADAFQAFNAMQATKQRHFGLMQQLDDKRTRYGLPPTTREAALLAALLADHDRQVKRFTLASAALKQSDAEAHLALFAYVGVIESAAGTVQTRH